MLNKYYRLRTLLSHSTISYLVLSLFLLALMTTSCRRDDIKKKVIYSDHVTLFSYSEVFEIFWHGLSDRYLFWNEETETQWDLVYEIYRPKFARLDTLQAKYGSAEDSVAQYFLDMTKGLKDTQLGFRYATPKILNLDGERASHLLFYPSSYKLNKLYKALPDTLFDYMINRHYLDNFDAGVYFSSSSDTVQTTIGSIKPAKTNKRIIFAGMNYGFEMKQAYFNQGISTHPMRPVINKLFSDLRKCDAFILDLRNNRGGRAEDINFLVGKLTTQLFPIGYMRNKASANRYDYTPYIPLKIIPQEDGFDFDKTLVILTNKYTAAVAETIVRALKSLPNANVKVIGEQTYGSPGYFIGTAQTHNAGDFNISSFMYIYLSSSVITDLNYKFDFDGIAPDTEVVYTQAKVNQMLKDGVDIQLEEAIKYINNE